VKLYVAPSFAARGPYPAHLKGRSLHSFRAPADVTAVCVHQTDVRGGFGADSLEARALRYGGTSLAKRGTPYHYVISPKDDAVVAVWHPRVYTFHGDRANAYSIGLAVDGRYPGDPVDGDQLAEGFRLAIEHARECGYLRSGGWIEAHAQHRGDRGRDPSPEPYRAFELAAFRLSIFSRPQHVTRAVTGGIGRALPIEWRHPEVLAAESELDESASFTSADDNLDDDLDDPFAIEDRVTGV
jgi:hypothetical protein